MVKIACSKRVSFDEHSYTLSQNKMYWADDGQNNKQCE